MSYTTEVNSLDLNLSIDSYQTFTGVSTREYMEEMACERLKEQGEDPEDYEIEIEFDMDQVLKSLADCSLAIARGMLAEYEQTHPEAAGIVLKIEGPTDVHSPEYYNYTTDSYTAKWTIDQEKLERFTDSDEFGEWFKASWWKKEFDYSTAALADEVKKLESYRKEVAEKGTKDIMSRVYQENVSRYMKDVAYCRNISRLDYLLEKAVDQEEYTGLMHEDADTCYYENGTEIVKKIEKGGENE